MFSFLENKNTKNMFGKGDVFCFFCFCFSCYKKIIIFRIIKRCFYYFLKKVVFSVFPFTSCVSHPNFLEKKMIENLWSHQVVKRRKMARPINRGCVWRGSEQERRRFERFPEPRCDAGRWEIEEKEENEKKEEEEKCWSWSSRGWCC